MEEGAAESGTRSVGGCICGCVYVRCVCVCVRARAWVYVCVSVHLMDVCVCVCVCGFEDIRAVAPFPADWEQTKRWKKKKLKENRDTDRQTDRQREREREREREEEEKEDQKKKGIKKVNTTCANEYVHHPLLTPTNNFGSALFQNTNLTFWEISISQ